MAVRVSAARYQLSKFIRLRCSALPYGELVTVYPVEGCSANEGGRHLAKEELLRVEGMFHEILPCARFAVTLDNWFRIIAFTVAH